MKQLFISILTLIMALACTPDEGVENNGNKNNNYGGGYKPTGKITVKGLVYGGGSTKLAGVVISDGLLCVQTDENGYFEIDSDLSRTKFITASIPSGYSAPTDENGLPIFYHKVTDEERTKDMVQHTFEFLPINNNPNRYTLIVGADPQPRARSAGYDNIAYHSLDMCEDFYRDMREKAATITDRNVYGMMLGDVVHENMSLYTDYLEGLKTLGFPMFNILGNHDNDYTASNDTDGRRKFEQHLGPTCYSFNIGRQHYVVLDNLIMKLDSNSQLRDYDQGLTEEVWQWLQNDLMYVDRSTTIMLAAHSPMFMGINMAERSNNTQNHRSDYAALFSKYSKVHAWAGHAHTTFNYVYPESSNLKNIEVHTVARSTGELWTNEYAINGTPRGYTVVEVDGDDISWYFKPTLYQRNGFTGKTSPQPEYKHRDYDFDDDGVAILRRDGSVLTEAYQMKVYKPGQYNNTYDEMIAGNATNKYVYVNVFLWDDKWEKPKYNGTTMTKVGYKDAYSLSAYEINNHYYTYGYKLAGGNEYGPGGGNIHTIFRAYEPDLKGNGTVTVVDRFGNEYSQTISW